MKKLSDLKTYLLAGASLATAAFIVPVAATAQETTAAEETVEVIVTASKRSERVRAVSGSVSAVGSDELKALGAQSLEDYIGRVPGVTFNKYLPGVSHVTLRGIATTSGNAQGQGTTGYFLNDVPLTEPGWTIAVPDIDTFDVNRVEVLRGPQGSLFGAASLGGAVNYIVNTANTSGYDAAIEATLSQTENAELSPGLKAMTNIPIIDDKLAIRIVGNYDKQSGYLDNIGLGKDGSNDITTSGGRVSLTFTPTADTTVTWLSLFQTIDAEDSSYQIPALGDLKRSTAIDEPVNTDIQIHSLRVDHDLGWATFTGLASYQKKAQDWQFDFDGLRAIYNADLGLNLTNPLYIQSGGRSEGRSIETRLASAPSDTFEWLIGASYFRSDKDLYEQLGSVGAAAQFDASPLFGPGAGAVIAPNDDIFNAFYSRVEGSETALFGEANYYFAPKWKLTFGGRLFKTTVSDTPTSAGFGVYGAPASTPVTSKTTEEGFSPKASLTYKPSDDLMVYGLVSKGFRFGTPNTAGLSAFPIPSGSTSDELVNYELGMRTNWLGNKLLVDATLFYVDWQDIQLRLQTPDFFNYAANGGSAKSQGVETSITFRPTENLDLSTAITYTDAVLTEDLFILWSGTAPKGSRLAGSSEWTVANTATYRFGGSYNPVLMLTHQFVSEGYSDMNSSIPGATPNLQGDYNLINARLRATLGKTTVAVFANNISDERGVTRTVAEINGIGEGIVRPRMVGVSLSWAY
ncbi:TonB-dependent receptor [Asticcacaulis endophyticus]|uniref:TonB-dependent receptor n=1 Tax=Asticcacaulis endophyticus TaxID=1395890 RepID=A0A918Q4V1_9CAUL|nr:TonB-dependent receptor [Asticcacaulis endophyticus]GGZ33161.1 TonB-dependent receptor [Asticcacaulis endophyticus]